MRFVRLNWMKLALIYAKDISSDEIGYLGLKLKLG
jgi:hypothetical protein